jgi:deoxyribonuclease-4
MLRFGPAGVPPSAKSAEEGVRLVASLGLFALELEFVRGVRMKEEEARRVGRTASELGVRLSAHAPYYINLNSRDGDIIQRSKENILLTMRRAHEMGARIVVVHAGFYSGMSSEAATEVIAGGVAEVRERADRDGLSGVVLGLETMGKKGSWGTFSEMRRVCSPLGAVQPVVDFAHLHARGQGSLRTAPDFGAVLSEFERFKAPFLHAHFTGIEWGPSGERRHLEVSAASPDFSLLAPLLLQKDYDATLICESPLLDKDALLMKRIAEKGGPGGTGR